MMSKHQHDMIELSKETLKALNWWLDKDDYWNHPDCKYVRAVDNDDGTLLQIEFDKGMGGWAKVAPGPRTIGELNKLIALLAKRDLDSTERNG